jgi:PadR family transcriptional regulator PadR
MLCIVLYMASSTENWKTQIRKGYIELCVLLIIRRLNKVYGFDLIEKLSQGGIDVKEGTLYPLLNRMSTDGILTAKWETEDIKGHPRKFYSLTRTGALLLKEMILEFDDMVMVYQELDTERAQETKK